MLDMIGHESINNQVSVKDAERKAEQRLEASTIKLQVGSHFWSLRWCMLSMQFSWFQMKTYENQYCSQLGCETVGQRQDKNWVNFSDKLQMARRPVHEERSLVSSQSLRVLDAVQNMCFLKIGFEWYYHFI